MAFAGNINYFCGRCEANIKAVRSTNFNFRKYEHREIHDQDKEAQQIIYIYALANMHELWMTGKLPSQTNKKDKYKIMYRQADPLVNFLFLLIIFYSKDESLYFFGFRSHFAQIYVLWSLSCHEFTPEIVDCTKCPWFL